MRKLVIMLALVSFSFMGNTQAHAAAEYNKRPVEINVNGKFISMDVHPTMDNNRLFIPIRSLASLGIHYSWNPSSKVVTLQNKNGEYLNITVGSKVAYKGLFARSCACPANVRISGLLYGPSRHGYGSADCRAALKGSPSNRIHAEGKGSSSAQNARN